MFNNKIRAWHPKLKQMFKVAKIDFEEGYVVGHPFIGDKYSSEVIFNIKEVVLSQASGLTDVDGLNVFEEDILDFEGMKCVLRYGNYGDSLTGNNGFGWFLDGNHVTFPYLGGAEKIGNIRENPSIVIGERHVT
jgi:uncharacterized phage protein (TIGR01671 family)